LIIVSFLRKFNYSTNRVNENLKIHLFSKIVLILQVLQVLYPIWVNYLDVLASIKYESLKDLT